MPSFALSEPHTWISRLLMAYKSLPSLHQGEISLTSFHMYSGICLNVSREIPPCAGYVLVTASVDVKKSWFPFM